MVPKVDASGTVTCCQEGLTGKQAKNKSEDLSEHQVQSLIAEKFPCYPLVAVPNPSLRALEVKGDNPSWTEETI
jgi:hypothetical protein